MSELNNPSFTRIAESEDKASTNSLVQQYQTVEITSINSLMKSYSDKYGQYGTHEALIDKIVKVEGPIHKELLMKKVADQLGYGRLGRRIKQDISQAISKVADTGAINSRDNFIYYKKTEIKIRDRSNLTSEYRDIDYVAPAEIQKGLLKLAEKSYGSEVEDLIKEVGSSLGSSRVPKIFLTQFIATLLN